ncbi:Dixin [Fukomys damarensis]|uniref:Dixin n=1 Tax=Fukomys damarensis TaxID=885580 RepID=A0A091DBU4_FUKDA|nr:Dixin [Fukomys damarensis]
MLACLTHRYLLEVLQEGFNEQQLQACVARAEKEAISEACTGPETGSPGWGVQGVAAALADVCCDMSQSGLDIFRYRQRNSSMDEEIENLYWSVPIHSAKSESMKSQVEEKADFVIISSEVIGNRTEETDSPLSQNWQPKSPGTYLETSWEEQLLEQQEHLEKEMEETKKMVSELQASLLNGSLPEDEQERPLALREPRVNPEEQLIIIQSCLDQSMEENQDLKNC